MIFDLHGQTLIGRVERGAFGNCPRLEDAFHLQPKIVVESGSGVALHDKAVPRLLFDLGRRLRSLLKAPFSFVFVERHGRYCSPFVWGRAPRPSKPSAGRPLPVATATLDSLGSKSPERNPVPYTVPPHEGRCMHPRPRPGGWRAVCLIMLHPP